MLWLFLSKRYKEGYLYFFSSRRWHTRYIGDWSSDVCSSDLRVVGVFAEKGSSGGFNNQDDLVVVPITSAWNYLLGGRGRNVQQIYVEATSAQATSAATTRSEERRVGKECRSQWARFLSRRKS